MELANIPSILALCRILRDYSTSTRSIPLLLNVAISLFIGHTQKFTIY